MLFIHPMWDHETQRIGKQRCTPVGYALHGLADLLGIIGLFVLLGTLGVMGYSAFTGKFSPYLLLTLVVPLVIGLISELLFRLSWAMARRRRFEYDPKEGIASWQEQGQRVTYRWELHRP